MSHATLNIGDLIVVTIPSHDPRGREQEGYRPAVVVGLPGNAGPLRYPMVLIAPLTTYRSQSWAEGSAAYVRLSAGVGGLPSDSVVLLDQVRALDSARVSRLLGALPDEEYAPIAAGLRVMLTQ